MPEEVSIPLQTDTLTNIPDGGIKMFRTRELVNGQLTSLLSQSVVPIDPSNGEALSFADTNTLLANIWAELKCMRLLLAAIAEQPEWLCQQLPEIPD